MSVPFYAKSPGNQGYIKNMEVVGFSDLNGINAFQMALYKTEEGKYYMYCGSFKGNGVNIVDVTDPATAVNADILRLMGVVSGTGGNAFHPNDKLTRAQPSPMAFRSM